VPFGQVRRAGALTFN